MRKFVIILTVLTVIAGITSAQKYALVDTEYILNNIPSYKAA